MRDREEELQTNLCEVSQCLEKTPTECVMIYKGMVA